MLRQLSRETDPTIEVIEPGLWEDVRLGEIEPDAPSFAGPVPVRRKGAKRCGEA